MNRMIRPDPPRLCDRCGEPWPRLQTHVCKPPTVAKPEYLMALLFDAICDCPLTIGGTDISASVAAELAMPLAEVLTIRKPAVSVAMAMDEETA